MPNSKLFLAGLLMCLLAVFASCGGGDDKDSGSPTPSTGDGSPDASATDGPTPDVSGPAQAVAIFGSPDAVRQALAATAGLTGIELYLLPGSAIGDGSFAAEQVPAGVPVRGARVTAAPRETGFADRYAAIYEYPDPEPPGFREAYDSVYLTALAALAAGSVEPAAIHDNLHLVANSPGEIVTPGEEGWALATETLTAGGDTDYSGASGLADLTADGDSSKSTAEVWTIINNAFTPLETRDVDLAAEIGAANPGGQVGPGGQTLDTPLVIGGIASLTGEQEAIGVALGNAMQLAVDEINAAGGILGQEVELNLQDDGSTAEGGIVAAEALRDAGASAIVGPWDGAIAAAVVGVTSAAGIPTLALSNSASLSAVDDGGFLFSLVSSELVEEPVLANLLREQELAVACVLYEEGAAGQAMADAFTVALEHKDGAVRNATAFTGDAEDIAGLLTECVGS